MKYNIKPVHLNLIRLRHKLDFTQTEYGERLSISKNLVGAIESGRCQPRIETISKALEIGNIPKQDLHDFVFDFNYEIPKL
jgi:transcriptional regulator with XRE-family HTH domain